MYKKHLIDKCGYKCPERAKNDPVTSNRRVAELEGDISHQLFVPKLPQVK